MSGYLGLSLSVEASGSAKVLAPTTSAQSYSSDEADSSYSTHSSPSRALTLIANQHNQCCVDGQYQMYSDFMFLNGNGFMTRILTLETLVVTGSLPTMLEIHNLFNR